MILKGIMVAWWVVGGLYYAHLLQKKSSAGPHIDHWLLLVDFRRLTNWELILVIPMLTTVLFTIVAYRKLKRWLK